MWVASGKEEWSGRSLAFDVLLGLLLFFLIREMWQKPKIGKKKRL